MIVKSKASLEFHFFRNFSIIPQSCGKITASVTRAHLCLFLSCRITSPASSSVTGTSKPPSSMTTRSRASSPHCLRRSRVSPTSPSPLTGSTPGRTSNGYSVTSFSRRYLTSLSSPTTLYFAFDNMLIFLTLHPLVSGVRGRHPDRPQAPCG